MPAKLSLIAMLQTVALVAFLLSPSGATNLSEVTSAEVPASFHHSKHSEAAPGSLSAYLNTTSVNNML